LAKRKPQRRRTALPKSGFSIRRTVDGRGWVLVHPRCARDMAEDLEEVQAMIEAGETEIALDELRWLLESCSEFIAAHVQLGALALDGGDLPLARGHFGAGYQLGLQAWRRAGMPHPMLYAEPANRPWFETGYGLVHCLERLNERQMADEIVATLTTLDESDPMQLRAMVDSQRSGGAPVVGLSLSFPKPEGSGN
jgi:hypothetical protein